MPGVDWRMWKAQLWQESRMDPNAVSPVGATGLAQFMPRTWDEVTRKLGWAGISPRDAEAAIEAGAFYMGDLRARWRSPRPEADRHSLAMASYNAGMGNLVKAQRLAGGHALYGPISAELHRVTGRHHKETLTYVERIWTYFTRMLLCGR